MKELFENLQGYIQSNIDLAKLEVQEKIDQSIKKAIKIGLFLVFGFLTIIFFLIFLSLLIGSFLANYVAGFGIITLAVSIISATAFYYWKQNKSEN